MSDGPASHGSPGPAAIAATFHPAARVAVSPLRKAARAPTTEAGLSPSADAPSGVSSMPASRCEASSFGKTRALGVPSRPSARTARSLAISRAASESMRLARVSIEPASPANRVAEVVAARPRSSPRKTRFRSRARITSHPRSTYSTVRAWVAERFAWERIAKRSRLQRATYPPGSPPCRARPPSSELKALVRTGAGSGGRNATGDAIRLLGDVCIGSTWTCVGAARAAAGAHSGACSATGDAPHALAPTQSSTGARALIARYSASLVRPCRKWGTLIDVDAEQTIAGPGFRPRAGGKSELQRVGCRVTPGGGNAEESATENRPPCPSPRGERTVRVKRRGKSPPRGRQRTRHGKPHPEQGRIGRHRDRKVATERLVRRLRVGCSRPPATGVLEE